METTSDPARALLDSASARSIAQANRQRRHFPEFALGTRVLVRIIPKRRASFFPVGLLTPKWAGPFRVLKRVSTSTYHLALPGPRQLNRTFAFNASALKPWADRIPSLPVAPSIDGPCGVDNASDPALDGEAVPPSSPLVLPSVPLSPAESSEERLRLQKEAQDLATSRFWINKWFHPSLVAPCGCWPYPIHGPCGNTARGHHGGS